jgi:hypothetical protein
VVLGCGRAIGTGLESQQAALNRTDDVADVAGGASLLIERPPGLGV